MGQSSTESTDFLTQALALLEKGLHVFPLGAVGETPPDYFVKERFGGDVEKARPQWPKSPRLSWKSFQSTAPTEGTVRSWWAMWPNANIGVACGELIAVDADSADAAAWCAANLPATPWRVATGKGKHFYFRANPDCEIRNSADPLAKIDTRGLGGYVVAGGSQHHSGSWYVNEIDPGVGVVMVSDLPMLTKEHVAAIHAYRATNINQVPMGAGNLAGFDASAIRTKADGGPVIEGGRNNAAASLAGQHFAAGLSLRDVKKLLDGWNATNPEPMSDNELNTTIASVKRTHEANHPGQEIPLEPAPQVKTAVNKKRIPKFPTHLLSPAGLVGEIQSYITRTAIKPQPVLSLGASLALAGTIMGRKVRTRSDLRTNLYAINIADSGAGKEHPRKAIKRLLSDAGCIFLLGAEDLASDAGLFATIFKQPACLLSVDEIGRFFRMVTNDRAPPHLVAIQTMLMRLSGSADSIFADKVRAENAESAVRVVKNPNVVLLGATVPGRLFQSLKKDDITDGFLPRILCFNSDDPDPDQQGVADKTPPKAMIETIQKWAARAINAYPVGNLDTDPNPLWVDATPDAQIVFDGFLEANRVRKAKVRGSGIDAMWARADEHAWRLALILACGVDFESPVIDRAHAEWACELVAFLIDRTVLEIDDNIAENEHEGSVKRVLKFIASKGAVGKEELMRKFRNLKADALGAIISTLQQTGDVEQRVVTGKGRPKILIEFIGAVA